MPLVRYKPANRSISARPRRPTTAPDSPLINRVHHKSSAPNRCVPRTLTLDGVRVLSIDPGDMDTPLHAAAVPDADRSTLKRPEVAARELADMVAAVLSRRIPDSDAIVHEATG